MKDLIIRSSCSSDAEFISTAIIEAEKSSTDKIPTCNIFSMTEKEYKDMLVEIFELDTENNEYSLKGFLIAELNGKSVGALNSWIEAVDSIPNSVYKSNLIFSFIDEEKLLHLKEKTPLLNTLTFSRTPGTIQLEYGYVVEEYRRRGIFTSLIIESIKRFSENYKVETILYKENYKSFNAFKKLNFSIKEEKICENNEIFEYYTYKNKVMMQIDSSLITQGLSIFRTGNK